MVVWGFLASAEKGVTAFLVILPLHSRLDAFAAAIEARTLTGLLSPHSHRQTTSLHASMHTPGTSSLNSTRASTPLPPRSKRALPVP